MCTRLPRYPRRLDKHKTLLIELRADWRAQIPLSGPNFLPKVSLCLFLVRGMGSGEEARCSGFFFCQLATELVLSSVNDSDLVN